MADNVAITAGSGTPIAAENLGGVFYQRFKLVDGTAGSSTGAIVTSVGDLKTEPRKFIKKIVVTPTVSSSPAYTAGDCLGGLQTLTSAGRAASGTGIVQTVVMLDKTQAQRPAMDLLFFDASVTSAGDNAAAAFSDADMANCIGILNLQAYNAAWAGTPLNSVATLLSVGLPFVSDGSGNIYVQAVVRNTPTLTSTTDLVFGYTILQS